MRRSASLLICYERLCFHPPPHTHTHPSVSPSLHYWCCSFSFCSAFLPRESSAAESFYSFYTWVYLPQRHSWENPQGLPDLPCFPWTQWLGGKRKPANDCMHVKHAHAIGECKRADVGNVLQPTRSWLNSRERQVSPWCFAYWLWKFLPLSSGTGRLCSSQPLIIFPPSQ